MVRSEKNSDFFAKIYLTPISYGLGVTKNSNIFYGNYKEMIARLIINNFMHNRIRYVACQVVKQRSNTKKTQIFLLKMT